MSVKKLTIGDWSLVETQGVDAVGFYITHINCAHPVRPNREQSYMSGDFSPVCWFCKEQIPDEMQALFILRTGGI